MVVFSWGSGDGDWLEMSIQNFLELWMCGLHKLNVFFKSLTCTLICVFHAMYI